MVVSSIINTITLIISPSSSSYFLANYLLLGSKAFTITYTTKYTKYTHYYYYINTSPSSSLLLAAGRFLGRVLCRVASRIEPRILAVINIFGPD